jgi:hypothetical protein
MNPLASFRKHLGDAGGSDLTRASRRRVRAFGTQPALRSARSRHFRLLTPAG